MSSNLLRVPIVQLEEILKLIPQKPPFVMVDRLLEFTPQAGKTGFFISEGNILLKNSEFSEPGLIEHMAQSMSLWRGYQGFLAGLQQPKTGFIGAIRNVELFHLPKAGEIITTEVEILREVMNVTSVSARTTDQKGKILAISEMKTITVD